MLIDDHSTNSTGMAIEGKGLGGSQDQSKATHVRPKPRAAKEKIYRDLVKQRQRQTPQSLATWAVEIVKLLRSRDAEARKQANRDIATFYQYYDCNEYGEFDEAGKWIPDAANASDDDFAYSVPMVPAHVDAAKTLLLKTALEYEYTPKNKYNVLDKHVADMCAELAEEDMTRIYTDTDLPGREKLYLLLAGKSYRHHYWARNPLEPSTVDVPIYSTEESESKAMRVCANPECGSPLGESDEICPKCLKTEIVTVGGGKINKTTAKNKTVTLAQNQLYVPNPLAVQHDLSKTNLNASFVIERDALPRAEAEFLYSQVLPTNRNAISDETMMVRELERSRLRTGNVRGEEFVSALQSIMGTDLNDLVERERCWLLPWQYANVLITEEHWYYTKQDGIFWCEDDKDLPENAKHIEPNTFLGDVEICTNGLFLSVIDENVVEINGASVSDNWIKMIFGARPANADGAGMRRLRHLADMGNDATNLEFKVFMDDADPKTFLDKSYLSHLSRVGEYNLVDHLKEGHTWENVVHRLEGAAAHPGLGGMNERVQAFAQFLAGTFSSIGPGAPDIKAAGTATGVVKMAEEAAGRYLEAVQQTKIADIESRYKILNNIRRNSIEPQKQEIAKRFGEEAAQRFFTCKLRDVVVITVKKGTDQPQSQAIKIAQMEAYSGAIANIGEHPDAPSLTGSFADMINLPITVGVGQSDREEANRRIGLLQEWAEPLNGKQMEPGAAMQSAMQLVARLITHCESEMPVMEQPEMPEPMPGDEMMPPEPPPPPPVGSVVMMQEHPVFQDACKDWQFTEGSKSNNEPLKYAVQLMWKLHYDRQIVKQQELLRIEGEKQMLVEQMKADFAAKNAPPMPPQPTPEDIAAQEDKAGEQQVIQSTLERIAEDEGKEADFERQERAKEADLERDVIKAEHAAEIAKEQQQDEPGKAAGTGRK